jgi:putative (di)nucleoside polyphosphate hydrolase
MAATETDPPEGYRPGVGILLFNHAGLVFIAQRIDTPGDAWQMPQGGIDENEHPRRAALRELLEEVGTDKAEIVAETAHWLTYDLPAALASKLWGGRYRGQAQKWFAARFLGADRDIRIDTDEPEFSAWKWAPLEKLPGMIVPFKRRLYLDVIAELEPAVRAAIRH